MEETHTPAPGEPAIARADSIAPGTALGDYLEKTRTYGVARFVLEMSVLALLLRIPAVIVSVQLGVIEDATTAEELLEQFGLVALAVLALIWAPIAETVLFQWAPIEALRRFGAPAALAAVGSATVFALLHFQSGVAAILVHIPTGLVLAWCYLAWRPAGVGKALLVTTGVHFFLNLLAIGAAAISLGGGGA